MGLPALEGVEKRSSRFSVILGFGGPWKAPPEEGRCVVGVIPLVYYIE